MKSTIPKGHLRDTCKIGLGTATCAYIAVDPDGMFCAKSDPDLATAIDARRSTMSAQGDNCPGLPREEPA